MEVSLSIMGTWEKGRWEKERWEKGEWEKGRYLGEGKTGEGKMGERGRKRGDGCSSLFLSHFSALFFLSPSFYLSLGPHRVEGMSERERQRDRREK